MSSYVFTLTSGAMPWWCQLQYCVTHSTIEVEDVATFEGCKEAIWLGWLVVDLGITQEVQVLHCDSRSSIESTKNQVFLAKTKHVDVQYHFIKELI